MVKIEDVVKLLKKALGSEFVSLEDVEVADHPWFDFATLTGRVVCRDTVLKVSIPTKRH